MFSELPGILFFVGGVGVCDQTLRPQVLPNSQSINSFQAHATCKITVCSCTVSVSVCTHSVTVCVNV